MSFYLIGFIILFTLTGMVLTIMGLPGSFLGFVGLFLASIFDGFNVFSITFVLIFFCITFLGEFLEYYFSGRRREKGAGAPAGVRGALIGGFLGAVFMSLMVSGIAIIIGSALGTFIGAFLAELFYERGAHVSGRSGITTLLGLALGS
ncbi:MAG: DUF456 domain-containing protein, partial [Elusimicrobia bacterium]|nr:DUF456 domain-containing protein [Elusimicrobiota bacterium]